MIIFTESNRTRKENTWLIHVSLGEVGLVIDAPSKEEAVRIANIRAHKMVSTGTNGFTIPKIVRINGKPYQAPPATVQLKGRID